MEILRANSSLKSVVSLRFSDTQPLMDRLNLKLRLHPSLILTSLKFRLKFNGLMELLPSHPKWK